MDWLQHSQIFLDTSTSVPKIQNNNEKRGKKLGKKCKKKSHEIVARIFVGQNEYTFTPAKPDEWELNLRLCASKH